MKRKLVMLAFKLAGTVLFADEHIADHKKIKMKTVLKVLGTLMVVSGIALIVAIIWLYFII